MNLILNGETQDAFSLKETRMLAIITTVSCVIGATEQCSEIRQRNKRHRDRRKCVKI